MKKENLKLFVGGYFTDKVFKGEQFEGMCFFGDVDTYSLEEALSLGFVGDSFMEWYEGNFEEEEGVFYSLSFSDKVKYILEYVENDEIAGLAYFDTEEAAEDYKNECIDNLEWAKNNSVYIGTELDKYGYFREIYEYKAN